MARETSSNIQRVSDLCLQSENRKILVYIWKRQRMDPETSIFQITAGIQAETLGDNEWKHSSPDHVLRIFTLCNVEGEICAEHVDLQ